MSLGEATINVRVKMASVKAEMDKAKSEIEAAGKDMDKPAKNFTDSWKTAKSAILPIVAGIGAAVATMKKVIDFSKEGAEIMRLTETSSALAKSMGMNMDEVVGAIRGASLGMVSDYDIMQSASRAMMLKVGTDAGQLAQLMEVAAVRGRAMGLSTTQAFNDIVTGLGRTSPQILDNLGIVIDAEATYSAYAQSIGKASSELTKAEKTQALLNGVLEKSAGLLAETGGLTLDTAGKWEQLDAAQQNFWNALKVNLAEGTVGWAEFWTAAFNEAASQKGLTALIKQAQQLGINTEAVEKAYQAQASSAGRGVSQVINSNQELIASLQEQVDTVKATENAWAANNRAVADGIESGKYALKDGGNAWREYLDIMKDPSAYESQTEQHKAYMTELATQNMELERQKELYEKVYSANANFSAITKLAADYTTQLKNITAAQERIAELEPFKETGGVLDGVAMSAKEVNDELEKQKELIEAAQAAMTRSANQMALDMFATSIAIDGVTEGEMQAYFDMAVQMGFISREAADMAMQAWRDAVDTLNGNPATPEVIVDTETARSKILDLLKMDITPINIPVTYNISTFGSIPDFNFPLNRADGGPVARGTPYWVGERGEPELFIPQESGHIVNQDTILQALSNTTNNTTTTSNVYNLHANYGYQNPLSLIEQVKILNLLGST